MSFENEENKNKDIEIGLNETDETSAPEMTAGNDSAVSTDSEEPTEEISDMSDLPEATDAELSETVVIPEATETDPSETVVIPEAAWEENEEPEAEKRPKKIHPSAHAVYLAFVGLVFLGLTAVFLFLPRTKYSELEKRDLATFPDAAGFWNNPSQFTADISHWFSDSEPYRDEMMSFSMTLRDGMRFNIGGGEDAVSFKPAVAEDTSQEEDLKEQGNPLANANSKMANAGILIVGSGPDVRALMAYGGTAQSGSQYIKALDEYVKAFPDVNIYALISPNATEFYLPDKAKGTSKSQKATMEHVRTTMNPKVKYVDVHSYLAAHTKEDIFLRTDHHWAPLGAFYAAKALAKTAGVPFKELDSYDRHVVHGYVGSMYGYSKDIAVKNAPEDFVYHTPKNVDSETTYITYNLDKNFNIASTTGPYKGKFFHEYPDGSGGAYCTFMGGDSHTVKIKTGTPSDRRILIIKDSYGNPIPAYLFYSFGEIHIVDFRYFPKNMKQYVKDNKITDLVLAFNVFNVCNNTSMDKVRGFLTQQEGVKTE